MEPKGRNLSPGSISNANERSLELPSIDDRIARFRKRLNRLRSAQQNSLNNGLDEVVKLLSQTVQLGSTPSPQPYAMLAQIAEQADELRNELSLEHTLCERLRSERDAAQSQYSSAMLEANEVTQALHRSMAEIGSLNEQIQFLQSEMRSQSLKLHDDSVAVEGIHAELESLRSEKAHLEEQVSFLSNELDVHRQSPGDDTEELVTELRNQLLEARRDIVELRMQNTDLADQIVRNLASKPVHESLTWEERKKILLTQLEMDGDDSDGHYKVSIQEVIASTQKEVERRDQEIAELKRIVADQSSARDGLAFGAAAIAQLLDADELIQEERQKLRTIQMEWEEKARAAEIELSRERAKIARQRLELENRSLELKKNEDSIESQKTTDVKNQKGNWLSRLGLKDDGSQRT